MAEGKGSSVLKWILMGCGAIVLLCIIAMVTCGYIAKQKYDSVKAEINKTSEG